MKYKELFENNDSDVEKIIGSSDSSIEKKWEQRTKESSSKKKPTSGITWSTQIDKGGFDGICHMLNKR